MFDPILDPCGIDPLDQLPNLSVEPWACSAAATVVVGAYGRTCNQAHGNDPEQTFAHGRPPTGVGEPGCPVARSLLRTKTPCAVCGIIRTTCDEGRAA